MGLVALVLTVVACGASLGFVSIGTVQAHGGDGSAVVQSSQSFETCPATRAVMAVGVEESCSNLRP